MANIIAQKGAFGYEFPLMLPPRFVPAVNLPQVPNLREVNFFFGRIRGLHLHQNGQRLQIGAQRRLVLPLLGEHLAHHGQGGGLALSVL